MPDPMPIQKPKHRAHDSKLFKNVNVFKGVRMKFKMDPYFMIKQTPTMARVCRMFTLAKN